MKPKTKYAFAALTLATIASANDSYVSASGGTVTPLKSNPSVRMVREDIYVKLPDGTVEARFVFKNEGPATTIKMGFPEESYNMGEMKKGQQSRFKYFKSWINGKPVSVARKTVAPHNEEDYSEHYWWVKDVPFKAGETIVVLNRYKTTPGGSYIQGGFHEITYIVSTGAPWKGAIGTANITFDLGSVAKKLKVKQTSEGFRRVGNKLVWKFKNFEPTEADDLTVAWASK